MKSETDSQDDVTKKILQSLKDMPDRNKTLEILRLLNSIQDERIALVLSPWLMHNDIVIVQTVIQVIANQQTDQACQILVDSLFNNRSIILMSIIPKLGVSHYSKAIEPLIKLLDITPSETIQYLIIEALGDLKAVEAISVIRRYSDHKNHHVRERVRRAIEKLT